MTFRIESRVVEARVNLATEQANVYFDDQLCTTADMSQAVERVGYTVRKERRDLRVIGAGTHLLRLAGLRVSAAIAALRRSRGLSPLSYRIRSAITMAVRVTAGE